MKKLALSFLLLFSVLCYSQNYTLTQPRFRINRTASLALSTTWQTIDFSGTSTYNANTFGIDPVSGNRFVYWDATNKVVRFIGDYDRNFFATLFLSTSTDLITLKSVLQVRYVIPNGISAGVDLMFPFPDDANPFADIGEVTLLANGVRHLPMVLSFYTNAAIRANGLRVQVRLSNSLVTLGTCTLLNAALLVQ